MPPCSTSERFAVQVYQLLKYTRPCSPILPIDRGQIRQDRNFWKLSNGTAIALRFLGRGLNPSLGQFYINKYGQNQILPTVEFIEYNTSERKVNASPGGVDVSTNLDMTCFHPYLTNIRYFEAFLKLGTDTTATTVSSEVNAMPWLLGHPPLDKPLCGYTGDCLESKCVSAIYHITAQGRRDSHIHPE